MSEIAVISRLRFDPSIERVASRSEGATLAEIVAEEMAGGGDHADMLVVSLHNERGMMVIERPNWARVRPKAGTTVTIRLRVAGGNALKTALSLAIVAATAVFAAWALPVVGALGTALGSAAIAAGSQYLLSALFKTSQDKQEERYTIAGTRNQANPWGPVPQVLGRHRVYPPFAAMPYTEIIGDEQYLRCLFVIGEGPHDLSDWRIGETPLGNYGGVDIEIRAGWPTDTPVTLYEEVVIEDAIGVDLAYVDGFAVRRGARNTESLSVDIYFPGGLFWVDDSGDTREQSAAFEVQYRRHGENGDPDGYWVFVAAVYVSEAKKEPFWRSLRWDVAFGVGTYEVQIKRATPESTDSNTTDGAQWTVLRSIRHQYPVAYPRPLALIALRIKASKQLSGTVDQFNLIASGILPDWDSGSHTWVTRATSNPASIYRHVLQGSATALPRGDDEVNLDALAEWHDWCAGKGLAYNRYHDFDASARDTLAEIAAAGRGSPSQAGGLWSAAIDRPQTVLRAHISARNASGISGEVNYEKLPDAYRVKYLNELDNWKSTERVVNRPGLSGEPQLFEEIELPGYTHPDLVYRGARWRFAQRLQRFERWYATQDYEYLTAVREGLVQLQYPVLSSAMVSGRVKAVETVTFDGIDETWVTLDETVTMVVGYSYACRFRLRDGSTSLWTVATDDGETKTLRLASGGALPARGDLALFGLAGFESIPCVVKSIEAQKDLAARLTLVPHAPEIESIADAGTPPPVVYVPSDPVWAERLPGAPVITDVLSGSDIVTRDGLTGSPMVVRIQAGAGSVPVDHFIVAARYGTDPAIVQTVPASSGRASFSDFSVGESVSVIAVAVSPTGIESVACSPAVHVIKARTDLPADIATLAYFGLTDGSRHFTWTLDPAATADQVARIVAYDLRARVGTGWGWTDLTPLVSGPAYGSPLDTAYPVTDGLHTIGIVALDALGRSSLIPKLITAMLDTGIASRVGRLVGSIPANSGLIAAV